MKKLTENAVFHYIYVNEKDKKEDESLKSLQKKLANLSGIGIKEGVSSINQGYKETLDDVRKKMFPRQAVTEVLKIKVYTIPLLIIIIYI
jgi:hypothetical protein